MTNRILVCPLEPSLLSRLHGHTLVVRVREAADVTRARDLVEKGARLHCIVLDAAAPLAELALGEELKGIPLAVFVPGTGDLGTLFGKIPLLAKLRLMVFLPLSAATTLRDLRILSSLGVPSALVWDAPVVDWEGVEDLLAYAAFTRVPHAAIEPFGYVMGAYSPRSLIDVSAVSFNDPARYLHVSSDGRVAMSAEDLAAGRFIGGLEALRDLADVDRGQDYRARTDHFFLEQDGCAYCAGFRVCMGRFSSRRTANPGCEKVFAKLLEIAESASAKESTALWQP